MGKHGTQPTSLKVDDIDVFVNAIKRGVTKTDASALVGIPRLMMLRYLRWGGQDEIIAYCAKEVAAGAVERQDAIDIIAETGVSEEVAGRYLDDGTNGRNPIFKKLAADTRRAEAEMINITLSKILAPGDGKGWQRFGWLLERTHPKSYGQLNRNYISENEGDDDSATVRRTAGLLNRLFAAKLDGGKGESKGEKKTPAKGKRREKSG